MDIDNGHLRESLERRWFAVHKACTDQHHACDHIRQSLEIAERAWLQAIARLRELEAMRESLGERLAEVDAAHEGAWPPRGSVRTAA